VADDRRADHCRRGARARQATTSAQQCSGQAAPQLVAELDALNAMLREKYGELPDSTPLIRQERDRYG
jgi:hypothetical protein